MVAKKKESAVAYTTLNTSSPTSYTNITPQIPNYPDKQVKFEGYCKIPLGSQQYNLKKQNTRFYYFGMTAGISDNTFPRTNKAVETFQMRTLVWSWRLTGDIQVTLYDGNKNNPKFRIALASGTGTLAIDFEDIHRLFQSDIIIEAITFAGAAYFLAGAEFITFSAFGWDEEI